MVDPATMFGPVAALLISGIVGGTALGWHEARRHGCQRCQHCQMTRDAEIARKSEERHKAYHYWGGGPASDCSKLDCPGRDKLG